MTDLKRRPWTEDENRKLIELWDTVGSIVLISMMLDRSPSSVQTQASRINLPRRMEERGRHRRRWTSDDERLIDSLIEEYLGNDDRIPIDELAERMDRSVDAIVARLANQFGGTRTLLDRIVLPKPRTRASDSGRPSEDTSARAARQTANPQAKMRKCLGNCGKPFWSEGPHIRICPKCKKDFEDYDWGW